MGGLVTLAIMLGTFSLSAWLMVDKNSLWRTRLMTVMAATGSFVFVVAVVAIFM